MMKQLLGWSGLIFFLAMLIAPVLDGGGGSAAQQTGSAGEYPDRPVKLVVHKAAGSGAHRLASKTAEIAGKYGVRFVVESKTGTQGLEAMKYVLDQQRDGYTILVVTQSFLSNLALNPGDVSVDDFQFLATLFEDPEALIVNTNSGVTDFQSLLTHARQNPGQQAWLGPGAGGRDHLFSIKAWEELGIDAAYRAYKSGKAGLKALLGQEGEAYVGNAGDIGGAENVAIAVVASPARLNKYPDAPTFLELGYNLEEYMWRGFAFAAGVPRSKTAFMSDLFAKVAADPEWIQYVEEELVAVPSFMGHERFNARVRREMNETREYLSKAGLMESYVRTPDLPVWGGFLAFIAVGVVIVMISWRFRFGKIGGGDWLAVFFFASGLLIAWQASLITVRGAALVPWLWSGLLSVGSLMMILRKSGRDAAESGKSDRIVWWAFLLTICFYFAIYLFGSLIAIFGFTFLLSRLLGIRPLMTRLAVSGWFSAGIVVIFIHLLSIQLPTGMLL